MPLLQPCVEGWFDLLDPVGTARRLTPERIAETLAAIPRFGGRTPRRWSVAMHSVVMAEWLATMGANQHTLAWALLHDAAEAAMGLDVSRPLKARLRVVLSDSVPGARVHGGPLVEDYEALENRLQEAIAVRFGLSPAMPARVAEADNRMLATEVKLLWGQDPKAEPWRMPYEPLPMAELQTDSPGVASRAWMQAWKELRVES